MPKPEWLVETVISAVSDRQPRLGEDPDHGPLHWFGVARSGLRLLHRHSGGDPAVVFAFAVFHDAMVHMPDHGECAALAVGAMNGVDFDRGRCLDLDDERLAVLQEALTEHSAGKVTDCPTIGTCWDADRLQLGRFRIAINRDLLSTEAAAAMGRDAAPRHTNWPELAKAYDALDGA